jgi:hypothetical protein
VTVDPILTAPLGPGLFTDNDIPVGAVGKELSIVTELVEATAPLPLPAKSIAERTTVSMTPLREPEAIAFEVALQVDPDSIATLVPPQAPKSTLTDAPLDVMLVSEPAFHDAVTVEKAFAAPFAPGPLITRLIPEPDTTGGVVSYISRRKSVPVEPVLEVSVLHWL